MSNDTRKIPSLSEWAKETRKRKNPQYLIYPILPADNLVILSGVPKDAQKTFLSMSIALMLATGKSVPPLRCDRAERVLYIYEEGDRPGTLARFDNLAAGLGVGEIEGIQNLFFAHRMGFSIDNKEWVKQVVDLVVANNIKLVVIDTLAKCMQSDENNAQAVGNSIRSANQLRNTECSVLFVHHTRKEESRLSHGKFGTPEPDMDIRGSSALCGTYETHWAVRQYLSGDDHAQEKWLMVGGKEFPWQAYHYGFDFKSEPYDGPNGETERVCEVQLQLVRAHDIPYIEKRAPVGSKKE